MAVNNITDCPICFEELNDPRFLPCHHTFCFQCVADLRSRHDRRDVPCPLCRDTFNVQAADLRKNTYVEELARLYMTLAETEEKLDELDKRSSQAKHRLESRVGKLERKLSHAQSREQCLLEQQRETVNQVTDAQCRHEAAKIEAERHQKARSDAEASLETEKQSRRNLHQQLERTERENSEQANTLELERGQSKQEITRLTDQLAMAKLKLDRQEDYRMAHAEGSSYVFSFLTHSSGGKDVTGLTIGLETLLKVHPGAFSGQKQGRKTPRGPPGSALLLCVYSGSALLGDLLAVSRSVERDFLCSVDLS